MRKWMGMAMMVAVLAGTAGAADKQQGSSTLTNFQPAGITDKQHKKQQYDLSFTTSKNQMTCRTNENEKVNATEWVVGSGINYKVDGNKGQIKNTQSGKSVKCMIVRVAAAGTAAQ